MPESSQKIITGYLSQIDQPLDTDQFVIQVVPFETDDDAERYKAVSKAIDGLNYTLHDDSYLPDLNLSDADKTPLGRYGRMRLNYLQEHRPGLYTRLILSGKLYEHLAEINQTSRHRMEQIIPRLAQAEGVDEKLKAKDQMAWVGQMNNIRQRAEEIILQELIYG